MSTLVFLFFRAECVLCDSAGSYSHSTDRGLNLALRLLLQEVPLYLFLYLKSRHIVEWDMTVLLGFVKLLNCLTITLFMQITRL